MPTIPNFPAALLEEHKQWHHARHSVDTLNPPVGTGLSFCGFTGTISAARWPGITPPDSIRSWWRHGRRCRSGFGSRSVTTRKRRRAFRRSRNRSRPRMSSAGLSKGRAFTAASTKSPRKCTASRISTISTSRRATLFFTYRPGLVDRWYQNWEGLGRFREGMSFWCGSFEGASEEAPPARPAERELVDREAGAGRDEAGVVAGGRQQQLRRDRRRPSVPGMGRGRGRKAGGAFPRPRGPNMARGARSRREAPICTRFGETRPLTRAAFHRSG